MSNPEHYVGPWQVKYPNELQEKVKEAVEGFEEFLTLEPDAQDVFTYTIKDKETKVCRDCLKEVK